MAVAWTSLADAEPRLEALLAEAVGAVLSGYEPNEDRAYGEAKRYIAALVGWRRGRAPIPRQRGPFEADLDRLFEPTVLPPTSVDGPLWLGDADAYQSVCVVFYDALCVAAEARREASS
jgi:hypothetical protein